MTSDLGEAGGGDSKWNFAWALTAGASYAFTERLSVDVNYRYLNLGEASLGTVTTQCLCTTDASTDDIQAHEIRVGLRYAFY
ncbi:outer membrane protein [Methylobrevis pamukkalensis]|uniref:Outer membrane protein PagN n=1 Tax=Methylobrevis pamukkalensis TaxID=1439726 RepID=A0A1E3GWU2_9HYPH|nr:outer membrane beta-barrel protein [Methylobrevis pamukkalensis]ODN68517.1 Outer membrane protein PagN precursor [Methylobrevis pamukkalensis]